MKIKRAVLENALSKVKPGLEKGKEYIEQMKHVLFDGEDIATYNDHIAILVPFETDFKTSVKFEDLYKAITVTFQNAVNVDFSFDEKKKQMLMTSDKTKVGLNTTEIDEIGTKLRDLKKQLPTEPSDWVQLPEDFNEALGLCVFAASNNMMDGPLTCVHIKGDNVLASDNIRVSWYKFAKEIEGADFLINANDIRELADFPVIDLFIAESWCHFITEDDIIFSAKKVEYEKVIPLERAFTKLKGTTLTFPEVLKDKLDSMLFMVDGDSQLEKFIDIDLSKDGIICKTTSDRGWIEQEVDIDYKGKDESLCINPIFLSQVLSKSTTAIISKDRTMLESGNFKHMLMHKKVSE
jgi:DNA polymerase III sliding clamp (beta) subunit (PCNA family)